MGRIYVLTKAQENRLFLFEEDGWEKFIERLKELSAVDGRRINIFMRYFVGNAMMIELDSLDEEAILNVVKDCDMFWKHLMFERSKEGKIYIQKLENSLQMPLFQVANPWVIEMLD